MSQPEASWSIGGTTGTKPRDDINLLLSKLSDYIARCSSRIFYELKVRIHTDTSFCTSVGTEIPLEVMNGSALKTVISQGLKGASGWSLQARIAVVRMLLAYDRAILFAQLGALSEVHNYIKHCC
jgi:hypothetical protein